MIIVKYAKGTYEVLTPEDYNEMVEERHPALRGAQVRFEEAQFHREEDKCPANISG